MTPMKFHMFFFQVDSKERDERGSQNIFFCIVVAILVLCGDLKAFYKCCFHTFPMKLKPSQ